MNIRFIACNHGVQQALHAVPLFGPAYCTQQIGGLTRGDDIACNTRSGR
jgi:hypothetical protein